MPKNIEKTTTWLITANDLRQGNVVYLNSEAGWESNIEKAQQLLDKTDAEQRLPAATSQQMQVVDPYLIEVEQLEDGSIFPVHFREQFRVSGPTHQLAPQPADGFNGNAQAAA